MQKKLEIDASMLAILTKDGVDPRVARAAALDEYLAAAERCLHDSDIASALTLIEGMRRTTRYLLAAH